MRVCNALIAIFLLGCSKDAKQESKLFTDITDVSGIDFKNNLVFTEQLNPYTYRNFYNGAGVATGDINNDGLLDIYFAGNQADNKLYLNQGDLKFMDITDIAGVACPGVWSTGVTFVDINADGLLDIYVCKSGDPNTHHRNNELFINNGDLTFSEQSEEYGLDITGLSVQAAFFDYDKDGDLDCYLLTNSIKSVGNYDLVKDQREIPDPLGGGNKFFINQDGKFRDHSKEAGIYRSDIGFGLGITLGDFNNDSWTDIFVSNDFFERDYLYINDQQGSFKESLPDYFESISMGSMGADVGDLDNDGTVELFVTEMLPDSLSRKKTKTLYESWDKYRMNVQNGYHHQFSRNVLQKKISDKNYVEIGRFAGIAASEWSWGALVFDMNNDGRKDIFVANGIYKDLLDRDYLTYAGAEDNVRKIIKEEENAILKLIDLMPSSSFINYAFRNEGGLRFDNASAEWGLDEPMYSCGSAYGDFDNDGDLDLVVNNINAASVLYRNNTDSINFKHVTLNLSCRSGNRFAVGAQVIAFCEGQRFVSDNFMARGFQSSVSPKITMGLGHGIKVIDSLFIEWPDGGNTVLYNVSVNTQLDIVKEDSELVEKSPETMMTGRKLRLEPVEPIQLRHIGSGLNDFTRDRLLPMMYSNETPSITQGDVDGDGVDEVYIGGGKGQHGSFVHFESGKLGVTSDEAMSRYGLSEETEGVLFDADADGDLDFYMASGGRFFPKTSSALMDRIFLNDGTGTFTESPNALPFKEFIATSVAKQIDFDNDNDVDLVVGERFDPFVYGTDGGGYLLENDGTGVFRDVTHQYASTLSDIGMVTDIEIQDVDQNGWKDLIICGDWMPIIILQNFGGRFVNASEELRLADTEGWWHDIESGDFNKDGKVDFVLANHGLNSFFKTGDRMYVGDFDRNGSIEQIFCTRLNDKYYPVADKDDFLSQLPSMKKELLFYKDYGKKSIDELISPALLNASKIFDVKILSSILLISDSIGYKRVALPSEAQYAPLHALLVEDMNNDGVEDLIAGGNHYGVKPQFGRYDASHGWFFQGKLRDGDFFFERGVDLDVDGEIRDIASVRIDGTHYVVFAKYDDNVEIFKISW